MALFRRKRRPDYIDLGDQVAVSPERAEELARIASLEILERAEEPLWEPVIDAIALSIQRRHPSDDGDESLRDWSVQIAVPGYWARRYEEDLKSTEEVVSSLTDRLAEWLGANEFMSGAISEVCLDLCDSAASDPGSPRSLDAIPGIGDLEPTIRSKILLAATSVAHEEGLAEEGELPAGVAAEDAIAAWNIGFLARCCEASLPAAAANELDPVSKNLADLLAAKVYGEEKPWQYWVGTCLIDIGIDTFRELEKVTFADGDDPDEPVFPQMGRLVTVPSQPTRRRGFSLLPIPLLARGCVDLELSSGRAGDWSRGDTSTAPCTRNSSMCWSVLGRYRLNKLPSARACRQELRV